MALAAVAFFRLGNYFLAFIFGMAPRQFMPGRHSLSYKGIFMIPHHADILA